MSNPYYTPSGNPLTGSLAIAALVRNEFALINQGFNLLPTLGAGVANQLVVVNGGGTGLTTATTFSIGSGLATAPALPFTLDPTTGIYQSAVGHFNIAIEGIKTFDLTSSVMQLPQGVAPLFGTVGFTDTGIWGAIANTTNGYGQFDIQNLNSGSAASADFVVNNNLSTATTYYGDFGINSSTFSGTGSLSLPNATYLYSASGELVLGTLTSNGIHFVVANGATDAGAISASGAWTILAPTSAATALSVTARSGSVGVSITGAGAAAALAVTGSTGATAATIAAGTGQSALTLTGVAGAPAAVITGAAGAVALKAAGGAYTPTVTLTYGTTTTLDCTTANSFRVVLTGNITTFTVSNPSDGQTITVRFKQDASGSRTIAWPASFRWAGGGAPLLSTAINAEDLLSAQYDATDATWVGTLLKGVQ